MNANQKITSSKWMIWILRQLFPNVGTILVVLSLLFVFEARASSLNADTLPSTISYQGMLSSVSGTPIDATVGMTFRFYNVQSGDTALWTESHTGANAVPISNGLFNVMLGSITPISSTVWDNSTVYLGVQVQGDSAELSPREIIGTVPYSIKASNTIHLLDTPIMLVNNTQNSMPHSTEWLTLDISQYVPSTAKSVLLDIGVAPVGAGARLSILPLGSVYEPTLRVESTGGWDFGQGWVNLSGQSISYQAYGFGSNLYFYIQIVGYLE